LRDDPNYDALIATLYPDIDKYEEEVMSMLYYQHLVYLS
jgi:E3 ubiquitin-protein ligase RNF1/2